jgi:ribosomal-protein-alanine N-acetyltransferase
MIRGVRLGVLADLTAIAELHAACFEDAWDIDFLGRLLAQPGAFSLVAKERSARAGFAVARAVAGEAEILSLGVHDDFRRRGLGSELARSAAAHSRALGASELFLEVAVENSAARALYHSLGFREAGVRAGYYSGSGGARRDALILRLAL